MNSNASLGQRARNVALYRGVRAARDYGDVAAEWRALRHGCGLVDAVWRRRIRASGTDARAYLHGQSTQDIEHLAGGRGAPALLLTAQGKVEAMAAVYACAQEGDFEWRVDAADQEQALARAGRFVVADDVEFRILESAACVALVGPKAPAVAQAAGLSLPEAAASADWQRSAAELCGHEVACTTRDDIGVPVIEIDVVEQAREPICRTLQEAGALPAGFAALEIARIESGLPLYGADVDVSRLAVEARLDWAIHFAKGCYVGQEVVERSLSRGRLRRRLALVGGPRPLPVRARFLCESDGEHAGGQASAEVVTSAAVSPELGPIALAYLPLSASEPGTPLRFTDGTEQLAAKTLEWPRAEYKP